MKKIVVGITGASGSIYAKRLIEELASKGYLVHVIATDKGKQVFKYELSLDLKQWIQELNQPTVKLEDNHNLFAGVASGSHGFDAVIVMPCSMGTLAEISHGLSRNLLCRAADVALKEGRKLIIVPRETPFNTIHLENMCHLSKVGATIIPAMPGFYHHPQTLEDLVNFVVGKVLSYLNINHNLFKKWEDTNYED
ncbi:UbiX family flavin prenyltransferase [Turicibacter sanguinis]|uniref:UbiX family flavin prenyltransferase n=1 Tax=Turicibacter TaxID=191303 RepID=UPI0001FD9D86|nr:MULTISPECIES: flavin prenyltransferase UbiX [Turicibacter]EGC91089.1 polyprenyl P-hydroxybenzoate and phenylacrylic acid decarboxylase [Turicibacter sp. HGF1]MDB8542123.1 UbiX family flavin prenyltransferase [Turicibacter sanguinis]MDB8552623.1 UbiX family flavin prenyltransferase [Turicibacter sanguinis]MTH07878.1 UbiX family flavin prenyltransferase [Turicibacter sanguinis]MTH09571.1 UbiX family flavin prenyltransferase [Turicibacter sanguinis]